MCGVQHMLQNRRPLGHSIDRGWGKGNVPHEVAKATTKRLDALARNLARICLIAVLKSPAQDTGIGPKALIGKLDSKVPSWTMPHGHVPLLAPEKSEDELHQGMELHGEGVGHHANHLREKPPVSCRKLGGNTPSLILRYEWLQRDGLQSLNQIG